MENFAVNIRNPPMDYHVLTYGRFATWTYEEVYRLHPDYCRWTLETARLDRGGSDSTPQLIHFALYIYRKQYNREPPPHEFHPRDINALNLDAPGLNNIGAMNYDFRPAELRHQPVGSVTARPKAPAQAPPSPPPTGGRATSSMSGGPTVAVHLPTADQRIETMNFADIPPHSPESNMDRRRTFAAAEVVHDAGGDAAMDQTGNEGWVFPQERLPQQFAG